MNVLQKIADYLRNEYDGNDDNAKPMEITIRDMRFISRMHIELCALKEFKRRVEANQLDIGEGQYGKI